MDAFRRTMNPAAAAEIGARLADAICNGADGLRLEQTRELARELAAVYTLTTLTGMPLEGPELAVARLAFTDGVMMAASSIRAGLVARSGGRL